VLNRKTIATEKTARTEKIQTTSDSVISDETTSHSTKTDKNVSQVAGYVADFGRLE
jgi:hypothetical protein